jgi:hypothetical protein
VGGEMSFIGSPVSIASLHRVRNAFHVVAKLFDDCTRNTPVSMAQTAELFFLRVAAICRLPSTGAMPAAKRTLDQVHILHSDRAFLNILIWDIRD